MDRGRADVAAVADPDGDMAVSVEFAWQVLALATALQGRLGDVDGTGQVTDMIVVAARGLVHRAEGGEDLRDTAATVLRLEEVASALTLMTEAARTAVARYGPRRPAPDVIKFAKLLSTLSEEQRGLFAEVAPRFFSTMTDADRAELCRAVAEGRC